jgi:hypothetical protein
VLTVALFDGGVEAIFWRKIALPSVVRQIAQNA